MTLPKNAAAAIGLAAFLFSLQARAESVPLSVPLPKGQVLMFQPVFLDVGDEPLALREFTVGDRAGGGFQEYPTRVALGGSFLCDDTKGRRDWCAFLGQCEVTTAQWQAIMAPEENFPDGQTASLPACGHSWGEIVVFLEKLNSWLVLHRPSNWPVQDGQPAYVRLPTELEWEFAARGGCSVDANQFDAAHPYGSDLGHHEWFAGPDSSHGKIQPVEKLAPNPLGLFDMLGNVAELTGSAYQLEYTQGRPGGLVVRGGDVFTPASQMRSALRGEQPLCDKAGQPSRSSTVGFRLALGSVVFASPASSPALEAAWENYRKTRRVPGPASVTDAPATSAAEARAGEIERILARIEIAATPGQSSPEDLKNQIGLLRAALGDVRATAAKAEGDNAAAWVRVAGQTAFVLSKEMAKVRQSETLLELVRSSGDATQLKQDESRHANLLKNIEQAWLQYGEAVRQLQRLSQETVSAQFTAARQRASQLRLERQTALLALCEKHWREYQDTARVDTETWGAQLREVWNGVGE